MRGRVQRVDLQARESVLLQNRSRVLIGKEAVCIEDEADGRVLIPERAPLVNHGEDPMY
jgi:hypothetical protein